MTNNSSKREMSPTFKPPKRSKSANPMSDESSLSNPIVKLVDIRDTIPKYTETSTQKKLHHNLVKPKSGNSQTKELNAPPETVNSSNNHGSEIQQFENSLAQINDKLNLLAPLMHLWAPNNDRNLEELAKAEHILDFVAEEVTKRIMSSCNAIAYNLPDRTSLNSLKDNCLKACDMANVSCHVTRLRKKSDKSTCPLLFKFGCCNDAKKFIRLSKNISSSTLYKEVKVTPDLTPCQRRVKTREATRSHNGETANSLQKTTPNVMKVNKQINHDVDLDKPVDCKPSNKVRIPSVTKKSNDPCSPNPSCSNVNLSEYVPKNNTVPAKTNKIKNPSPKYIARENMIEADVILKNTSRGPKHSPSLTKKSELIKSWVSSKKVGRIQTRLPPTFPTTMNRFTPLMSCHVPLASPSCKTDNIKSMSDQHLNMRTNNYYPRARCTAQPPNPRIISERRNGRFFTPHPILNTRAFIHKSAENENSMHPALQNQLVNMTPKFRKAHSNWHSYMANPPQVKTIPYKFNLSNELCHQDITRNGGELQFQPNQNFFGIQPLVVPLARHIAQVISYHIQNIKARSSHNLKQTTFSPFPPG
ncbi:unnamed protein product [Schistosoma turkestanicum]|nr:unnamed protein product [Schistosoma turkestanicum]